jgi:2-hydroxychromene-2-carboxylate isomerase
MADPVLDFWFDFASTYSYLAAARIRPLAAEAKVPVRFRPFLLGPIFKAQGWDTSPFNLYDAKGRHMWRDMERLAAELMLTFRRPDPFPQNSLLPSRVALLGLLGQGVFCRRLSCTIRARAPHRRHRYAHGDFVEHECRCHRHAASRAIG